jgi:hypothetical protein
MLRLEQTKPLQNFAFVDANILQSFEQQPVSHRQGNSGERCSAALDDRKALAA